MSEETARTTTRRHALRLMAAGMAGSVVLPSLLAAAQRARLAGEATGDALRIERIGLQLYSVRTAMAKDLAGTIAAIAAAGVTELEFAGYYDKDAAWWKHTLKQHGLTAPSVHIPLPATDGGWDAPFAMAREIGHQWAIMPYLMPGQRTSLDDWKRVVARLNVAAEKAKAAGLEFAYHNHDFEFETVGGTTPYELITSGTDASLVKLELDLYWTVKAGKDPLTIMSSMPGRVTCVHVKDAGPLPERKMMNVGAGTIDFKTIIAKGRTIGLQHWFMEHDQPADPMAFVKASAAAMKTL